VKSKAIDLFAKRFGKAPKASSRAPGRLEILGNHTDYNEGFVLSAATGQATAVALSPKEGRVCTLHNPAVGEDVSFDLDKIEKPVPGDWTNYVKGVLKELERRSIKFGAFDAAVCSDVPLSAGMSSSAALEIAFCFALREVYGIKLSPPDWARVGQAVENKYLGLKSGLLDQFSSIYGRKDSLILCDFRSVEVLKTVAMPPGWRIVVANTMVKHNLVESDYNRRRESCERAREAIAKKAPAVKALRDVDSKLLEASKGLMDSVDYRRALHIVGEDERVMKAVELLERQDAEGFGKLLFQSHESSKANFENSCEELDALVELAHSIPGCAGARLSGGGFGGISIHMVKEDAAQEYCARLKTAYKLQTGKTAETIVCSIGDGAAGESLS